MAELITRYREHRPDIQLASEVREMLEGLRGRYKLGLLTDGYLPAQKLKVAALEIENCFDYIVYTEELGRAHWKPSSLGFERMVAALDCSHKHCVYVGDNPAKDFIAPNQLGWMTIQLRTSQGIYHDQATSEPASADRTFSDMVEMTAYLLK